MKNSTINFIERLISHEEFMAETINTEHEDFEGSSEQNAFRLHQSNIVMLEKIKSIVEENQHLKQRELELMAQVERLRYWLEAENESLRRTHNDNLYPQAVDVVLRETPQQSLAEHDAEIVDKFARNFIYLVESDGELSGSDIEYLKSRYMDYWLQENKG